ncbi:hypothetical protein TTHT_0467 [Thermotomaculum hydrothermale]|uniref:FHA domain-containing protein n=1 Tax=Thermotomaculum hydrothermale TaxID=981385 RepID=A0A7R6PE69_9BACT|nr:FHA domain-containing protein [Thermotomaculum hydrothermale]BBB32058.1 hypothetical protein TTHT_0467 [Thermotomaculum hydrothermale]
MDFKEIDKIIKSIKKLDDEKQLYLERVEKLEEKKTSISEIVYEKIRGDYEKKIETLNAEIYPLIEQLAVLKSEIDSMLKEIEGEISEVNIKKEEIQVRCDLGEFSQEKADEMIKALEDENKERFELYEKLKKYSEKMDEVLQSNILMQENNTPDLEEPEVIAEDFQEKTADENIADISPGDIEGAFETKTGIQTGISVPVEMEEDGTVFEPSEAVGSNEGKTMLIRQPKLEIIAGGNEGTEFRLKLGTTNIGNDESNDIVIDNPTVEFKHAQIVFEPEGFKIYDFNSEKGIFVNGVKVNECVLKVGDIISLGNVQLKFKE